MNTSAIERLTAHFMPHPLLVEGDTAREQRHWVVRITDRLPADWNAEATSEQLNCNAVSAVRDARSARGLELREGPCVPQVRAVLIDEQHVLVSITSVKLEKDDAHAWLVAASAALRTLEKSLPVDDIQGIPRRFWRLVLGL
jgi:hypothetical protein